MSRTKVGTIRVMNPNRFTGWTLTVKRTVWRDDDSGKTYYIMKGKKVYISWPQLPWWKRER